MQYLVWSDGTRVPITDVVVQGDETAFTVQALPKPLANCFVFDDDNGDNQTAHGILPTSVNAQVTAGQSQGIRVVAVLSGQKVQMASQPAQPTGPQIDPNKAYSRSEIAAILGITEPEVQQRWDNWDAQNGPRLNYNKQTGRGPARVSTGAQIQQYLTTHGGHP